MCIIAYKPLNVAFPEEYILHNCFDNNDDGAGFMYAAGGEVHIHKGYETFEKFMAALNKARAITGDKVPYVMHFRIATQGYEKTMTHPFPLSSKMENLKRLHYKCSIGVAHNGILDITSDGAKTYSDTMKFITDYLSNIIQSYDWYKNKRIKKLIEYLIEGSRLAILDAHSHCELMGKGWEKDNGIYYSNHTWAYKKYVYTGGTAGFSDTWSRAWWDYDDYGDDLVWDKATGRYVQRNALKTDAKKTGASDGAKETDPWKEYFSDFTRKYYFDDNCPGVMDKDFSYCEKCANCMYCSEYGAQRVANAKKAAEA
jgi:hypothetical protein